uniref:Retrotransposon gag domain-containing protein n=1 Tax=Chenopodium quinoa TaxID=63459 RepID=A0A803LW71_CHEQI
MMKRRTTSFQIRSSHNHKWKRRLFFVILLCLCIVSFVLLEINRPTINLLMPFPNFFAQKPKIAFLFIARNRLPLDFVWDSFFRGDKDIRFSVFVHSRPGFLFNKATTKSLYFLNRQVNDSVQVDWGEASMIQAERILLKSALVDPANERFIFLSDSCVPLYNLSYTYDYIMSTSTSFVDSFILALQAQPVNGDNIEAALLWFQYENRRRRVRRWVELKALILRKFRPHEEGGLYEQWMALQQGSLTVAEYNRKFVKLMAPLDTVAEIVALSNYMTGLNGDIRSEDGRYNPKMQPVIPVTNWRKGSQPVDTSKEHNCIPDEHYVQTLLALEGLEGEITRRSLTHTAWDLPASKDHERRGWHPVTYKFSDATSELILSIKDIDNIYYETENRREWCSSKGKPSPCFLFARKFTRPAALRLLNLSLLGS